jgi:predicted transcriptional regulator
MSSRPFSLKIDPALKNALDIEARREGRPLSQVMRQAVREHIDRKVRFRRMIGELEAETDKGRFVSGEAINS